MKTIGITGGIGSGKSFVCNILKHLGYSVYDSDRRAKELYDEDDTLRQELIRLWGAELYDEVTNKLQRQRLAQIIFSDSKALEQINALVHPKVRADFERWREQRAQRDDTLVFIESALIVGSPLEQKIDLLWAIVASETTRIGRAMVRDNVSEDAVRARMQHQILQSRLIELADWVINNDTDSILLPQIQAGLTSALENNAVDKSLNK